MMPPKSAGRAKVILRNSSDRMDFKPLVVCIAHFSFILFPAVPPAAVAISLSLHCVIPVSYTHLDVYKRQVNKESNFVSNASLLGNKSMRP